jgi:nicotinamidase-related amidase
VNGMSSVINLQSYIGASHSRMLVVVDLQESNYDELARNGATNLAQSLENCLSAIRHARRIGLPIAFTRQARASVFMERSPSSAWLSGFEPKRSDMVFERQRPSCYANQFFDDVVSRVGSFAMAGLIADETCLATAIDASHRGHRVTFLSDASACRQRPQADARSVHVLTTNAIELFADVAATRHWLIATSPRPVRELRHG